MHNQPSCQTPGSTNREFAVQNIRLQNYSHTPKLWLPEDIALSEVDKMRPLPDTLGQDFGLLSLPEDFKQDKFSVSPNLFFKRT